MLFTIFIGAVMALFIALFITLAYEEWKALLRYTNLKYPKSRIRTSRRIVVLLLSLTIVCIILLSFVIYNFNTLSQF